jgi:YHS domain-containing protein
MLLRALALLILVLSAISAIRRTLRMLRPPKHEGRPTTVAGDLVKDPVCGTYVPKQSALSARNEFFCSEECRSKFLSEPRDFHRQV